MNKRKKSAKCVGNHLSIYTSNRFSIHAELRVWPLDQSKSNIQSHFSSFLISAKPWGTYLAPELLNAKLCSPASCFNWCWPSCCIQWVQSRLQQKITLMKTACAPEKQNNEGKNPAAVIIPHGVITMRNPFHINIDMWSVVDEKQYWFLRFLISHHEGVCIWQTYSILPFHVNHQVITV